MGGKILIADSVAGNRIQLQAILRQAFYEVAQATTGVEALRLAAAEGVDLAIVAPTLPDMSGLTLRRKLRRRLGGRGVPTILLTDALGRGERAAALAAGADDVLERPVNPGVLSARLRSLLRARDAEEELQLRDDTKRALGLAEEVQPFRRPATVGILSVNPGIDNLVTRALVGRPGPRLVSVAPNAALGGAPGQPSCDVFVLAPDPADPEAGLALLTELRARRRTRLCPVIVVLNHPPDHVAVRALDLGASELLCHGPDPDELAIRMERALRRKQTADQLRAQVRDGLQASVTDPLTGLYNRRYALPYLDRVARRARKTGRDFALMIVDIDHFKRINDRFGHASGDAVLAEVARRLRGDLRAMDMLARIGGEEFLIVMPDTSPEDAHNAACRLCAGVDAAPVIAPGGAPVQVTVSIGVAMASALASAPAQRSQTLMQHADEALYTAKSEGRNKALLSRPAA